MMTTLQNKECGKGSKKTFAPPAQKKHSLVLCSPNAAKEETLGISFPGTEGRLEKKDKATTENGPSNDQEKKGKTEDNKQAQKKEKEKSSLTNAEFEEIVQIVLQKSLQECLENEKMEKAQGGHEHKQKDQSKKMVHSHSQIRHQQKGKKSGFDLEYNHCDIPEETWIGHESDVAYASYVPGSIIWAKQYGYPWWPGIIESDPDLGEYFLFASHLDSLPSKYHVTFFGETVSRAWIPVTMLKNFQELSLELARVKKYRNKECCHKLGAALMMAQEAEQISIQERVNLFGFRSRYNRSDCSEEGKDLMLSGDNKPDSCLEKEEEESVKEKEEKKKEKKDPVLPHPKPAKRQTKKPKQSMADGQDGILQGKMMKRSLDSESAAPIPIKRRNKGQGNSDSDQPGGNEVPRPKEPLTQEAGSVPTEDEASSDLDLDQLMEDVGRELEQREELKHRDDEEEFAVAFFEE
ncbi:Zinc finger CW-type PWWP domain protein 1 [Tupaia chinensis]|uniref:Zinc finger CW-type PWWP domain protein 1 n=1 Tax=Tupaia chinensis TaxID=246437 RepID=L9K1X9_TUPCH|nr:Zinc finger CW-type PWWP domain protein 1 [Tupaia chinensis]